MLFGVFATHSPESCPMNNKCSRKIFLQIQKKIIANQKKFSVSKIVGFYMSVLEHQWIIILDAKSAHEIEQLCIVAGISATSTIKVVPINDYSVVLKKLQ